MGIDWGRVRLGLAISDPSGVIATPAASIKRKSDKRDIEEIVRIAEEENVSEMVVGMPLNINGEPGKSAMSARAFAGKLEKAFGGPVHLVDERYSSHAAERSLLEADLSRERRKQLRDGVAAAWVLQGFLDSRKSAAVEKR